MKKIIFVIILLIALCGVVVSQEDLIKLSIAPFDDSNLVLEKPGITATETLTQLLSHKKHLTVRTPDAIRNYTELLEKVQLGIEEPAVLKEKSSTLQIDYLIVGSIGKIRDKYELDARMVDVDTWKIVSACGIQTGSVNAGIDDIASAFTALHKNDIQQSLDAIKENAAVGIHEFREHYENPPDALYCAPFMEMLTSALASKTKNIVVESKFASHLIEEKAFEMTGIIENSKADAMFAIQGIAYRIIGDIRVFPDMMTVNYKIVNTGSQSVVFTGSVDVVNPSSLRAISIAIAKIIDDALNNRIGNLTITTTPVDADIYIDDSFAGSTKNKKLLVVLQKGNHTLTAKAEGFKAFTCQTNFVPNKTTAITIQLERITERYLQEAMVFESQGQYEKAVDRYGRFIQETGNTSEANVALYRTGHILLNNLKDYTKAKETFTTLLNNYPEAFIRAEGYFGLAQTYLAMGNKDLAKSTIDYLLQHYPESNAAQEAKAIIKTFEVK